MSTRDDGGGTGPAARADLVPAGGADASRELLVRLQHGVAVTGGRAGDPAAAVPDLLHDVVTRLLQKIRDCAREGLERLPGYVAGAAAGSAAAYLVRARRYHVRVVWHVGVHEPDA